MNLPARLHVGDSLERLFVLPEYPAHDGWTLRFVLLSSDNQITCATVASGAAHSLSIASSISSNWAAGRYRWQATVHEADRRHTVAQGDIELLPDFTTQAVGLDARSHVQRTLEAIEATLEGRASGDVASYQIAGRELRKIPLPELLEMRDRYRRELLAEKAAERLALGLQPRNKMFVRL